VSRGRRSKRDLAGYLYCHRVRLSEKESELKGRPNNLQWKPKGGAKSQLVENSCLDVCWGTEPKKKKGGRGQRFSEP